jgi:hypothetical protein
MKLRIQGDSIRFRLQRHEVEQLQNAGRVEETIHFPSPLTYAVSIAKDSKVAAAYREHRIEIGVPAASVKQWAGSDDVSIEGRQTIEGHSLQILIEKDFKCLHAERAEDADAFPNPREKAGCEK